MEQHGDSLKHGVRVGLGNSLPDYVEFDWFSGALHREVSIEDSSDSAQVGKLEWRSAWIERVLSRLFRSRGQRHPPKVMLNLLIQFALELVRALLVDALSGHVRRNVTRWFVSRGVRNCRQAVMDVHRRNRGRLLNRLLTEIEDDM